MGINCMYAQTKIADMITFPSLDGLTITADLYHISDDAPTILLCHQARYSRGEYIEMAIRLGKMGYNCLAIDQRSGDKVNNVINETAKRARDKGLPGEYIDALPDIEAALKYIAGRYNQKIILVGSSYSASLVLKIASESDDVRAIIAFSPGEYFGSEISIKESIKGMTIPVFVTSSKSESAELTKLVDELDSNVVTHFIPTSSGDHGSKVLWSSERHNVEYWDALTSFLEKIH